MQQLNLPIIGRRKIAEETYEITFGLANKRFSFEAGQYIDVSLKKLIYDDARGNKRNFSIASSSLDKKSLTIAFRYSGSGFKRTLLQLPLRSRVQINGPFGIFTLKKKSKLDNVLIAGGIGITPLLSMLKFAAIKKIPNKFTLHYFNSNEKRMVYRQELDQLAKNYNNIKVFYHFRRADKKFLKQKLDNLQKSNFFIAGPPNMVEEIHGLLAELDIPEKHICYEEFSGYGKDIESSSQLDKLIARIEKLGSGLETDLYKQHSLDLGALLQALNTSALVSESNAEGTITYANDKFVEVSKYRRSELMGQNHRILKSGAHSPSFFKNMWQTISNGKVWRGEIKNKAKDGSYYWVDTSIAPILGRGKKPIKYISVRFPISERRRAEEELRRTAREQAVISALSQQALASTNLQSLANETVRQVAKVLNIRFSKLLKLLPDGKNFFVQAAVGWEKGFVGSVISNNIFSNQLSYLMKTGKPLVIDDLRAETRFVSSSDLEKHGIVSGLSVMIRGKEKFFGILSVYSNNHRSFSKSDVNFLQSVANILANAESQQLERRKDEFMSIASHELRTPLTSIKGFTQLLQRRFENLNDEKTKIFLGKIDSQLNKLSGLISDLLDITKINAGKLEYNDELFSLGELIRDIVYEMNLTSKKHEISYKNQINNTKIYGDKFRIGQVLTNLLNNAIKYSPDANKVVVDSESNGKNVTVSVQDFGVGISKEDQAHIFERFYQGSNLKRLHFPGGLGIGLFISSEIIKRYRGKIWVKSAEGRGSTFYISLPNSKN